MESELAASQARMEELQAVKEAKQAAARERQRSSIVTPGAARPFTGQRRFGL